MNYFEPILGGVLIGLGSLIAMAASGKIPGISGIVARLLLPGQPDKTWRILFLVGLVGGAAIVFATSFGWQNYSLPGGRGLLVFALAGLVVGLGTRIGGGCTSGHGVCGIGSGAKDGLIYTIAFMAAGILTVLAWNALITS